MSELIERVILLAKEVEEFPLEKCCPSDDPDKQTAYLYSFRDIVTRFLASSKRVDNKELQNIISNLDPNPEFIQDAYTLKAELIGVIDLIKDIKANSNIPFRSKIDISAKSSNKLLKLVCKNLESESANNLPIICRGYGLQHGTVEECFKSKYNYIHSRITTLQPGEVLILAEKMRGKYPNSELDNFLNFLYDDDINVVAKFDDIRELIICEIKKSKFLIWVAVAWLTDTELANLLYLKAKQGVNVQIILNNDEINSKTIPKLQELFETHLISNKYNYRKLMHHKFCVIDLKKVLHGSYNWTIKAEYNDETISLIEDRAIAEEFALEFTRIKSVLNKRGKPSHS